MPPFRAAVPVALTLGLIAAAPAGAHAAGAPGHGPAAHAAGGGGGAPPTYPALVNSPLVRTQSALDRAVSYSDDGQSDKAVAALLVARVQLKAAWRAAKYEIIHAPPPPVAADGRFHAPNAHTAGGAVPAGTVADQYQTAGAVLTLQHTTATTAIGMIDMAKGAFRDSLSRTIFTALDGRDAAVAYIHSIDTPPPVAGDGRVHPATRKVGVRARAAGGLVAGGWGTVMPQVASNVDDEVDQIEGTMDGSTTLGPGVKGVLRDAELQVTKTQRTVNEFWPPAPAGDG